MSRLNCFSGFPALKKKFKSAIGKETSEQEQKNIALSIVAEHLKELHSELNKVKAAVGEAVSTAEISLKELPSLGENLYSEEALKELQAKKEELERQVEEFNRQQESIPEMTRGEIQSDDDYIEKFFDPAELEDDIPEDKRKILQQSVKEFYEDTEQFLGHKPTFQELVDRFAELEGEKAADKAYNGLKLGWELNNYGNLRSKAISSSLSSVIEEIIKPEITEERTETEEELLEKELIKEQTPGLTYTLVKSTEENSSGYKIVSPAPKLGYVSILRSDEDSVAEDGRVNSKELLSLDKYGPGTKLTAVVPKEEELNNIDITIYDDETGEKKEVVKFGEWKKGKTEQQILEKIPVFIENESGERVAYVHDVYWYNPSNVGFEDLPAQQEKLIQDARKQLLEIRTAVMQSADGKLSLTITEKRLGKKHTAKVKKPVSEMNPGALVGVVPGNEKNKKDKSISRNVVTSGGSVDQSQIYEGEDFTILEGGHMYLLFPVGKNKEGKPLYYPSRPEYGKIKPAAIQSVAVACSIYSMQNNLDESHRQVHKEVLKKTGLDLTDANDLQEYINLFIRTNNAKAGSEEAKMELINTNSKIPDGTPFVSLQNKAIMFGIKGHQFQVKNASGEVEMKDYLFISVSSKGDNRMKSISMNNLTLLYESVLPLMSQNVSMRGLENNSKAPMVTISLRKNEKGGFVREVREYSSRTAGGNTYEDYLKDNLKTNIRGYNIGTAEEPEWVTFVQPVIHYTHKAGEKKEAVRSAIVKTGEKVSTEPENTESPKEEKVKPVVNADLLLKMGYTNKDIEDAIVAGDVIVINYNKTDAAEEEKFEDPGSVESYDKVTDETVSKMKKRLNTAEGIDSRDRGELVMFLSRSVEMQMDEKGLPFTKENILSEIKRVYEQEILAQRTQIEKDRDDFTKLYESGITGMKSLSERSQVLLDSMDAVEKNWKIIEKETAEEVERITRILSEDEQNSSPEDLGEREKNFSKNSIENNGKESTTARLKRFFSSIPNYTKSGREKRGFLGVVLYPGFDYTYEKVGEILSSREMQEEIVNENNERSVTQTPYHVRPSFNSMLKVLENASKSETVPWVTNVIGKLNNAPEDIKLAFVSNMNRHTIQPKLVIWSEKNGRYTLKVYDTNSTEKLRVIQTQWMENFKIRSLSKDSPMRDDFVLNKERAKQLLDEYQGWMLRIQAENIYPGIKQMQKWLQAFGIDMSDDAMKYLLKNGYYSDKKKVGKKKGGFIRWKQMFDISDNTDGVFGLLARKLELIANTKKENLHYLDKEFEDYHPLSEARGVVKRLAEIERKFSLEAAPMAYRDAGKGVYARTPDKFACWQVERLRSDMEYLRRKMELAFEGKADLFHVLAENEDIRARFAVEHLGIEAIKQLNAKLFRPVELTSASEADYTLINLGMHQDTKQGNTTATTFNGIPMRMGRTLFPTMSDKDTMLILHTAVLKLGRKDLMNEDTDEIQMSERVKELLFRQLVELEFDRITDHHRRAAEKGVSPDEVTDQRDYNKGAQMFHLIPEMNNLVIEGADGEKIRLIRYIAENATLLTEERIAELKESIKPAATAVIQELVNSEMQDLIGIFEDNGFITRGEDDTIEDIKHMDSAYLQGIPGALSNEDRLNYLAMDFVISSLYNNSNMVAAVTGDIANFTVEKKVFSKELFEDGKPYLPTSDKVYSEVFNNKIGVNMGKRLAYLIAPGSYLAESVNDTYVQLFLEDAKSITENAAYLIELHYKGQLTPEVKKLLATAYQSHVTEAVEDAVKKLQDKFPLLEKFFNIQDTDGQEYTTAKESLDIIYRQGKMRKEKYDELRGKLDRQYASEKKGEHIREEDYISAADIEMVFNPIKPVYTGHVQDDMHTRVVYIKTSSFPLLPQLTQGTELDNLRRSMEEIQARTGKNVRAVYSSGAKVGAPLNAIRIWDNQGRFIKGSVNPAEIIAGLDNGKHTPALYLNREQFRIQQDVPFKSFSKNKDEVTFGTQLMKLLFGDGISKIEDTVFPYKDYYVTGKTLYSHYNTMIDNWITNEKSVLYRQLGLDERTGEPVNKKLAVKKLQQILKEEVTKRGYPIQDLQALDIIASNDEGTNDIQFVIPLWLLPNSNRYEALLNSIVANRVLKLKMPGNSFVAASEAGFKYAHSLNGLSKEQKSKIVYTKNYKGKLRANSLNEDGTMMHAQVLAPSKFRNKEGKLIDLIKDGYAVQDKSGRWILKEDMISPELLTSTSFRIPTAAHSTASQIEIVGFIPVDAGDLIVLPKNFTTQMGLDFDVDKQNLYSLWHTVNKDGRIVPIDESDEYPVDGLSSIDQMESEVRLLIQAVKNDRKTNKILFSTIDTYREYTESGEENASLSFSDAKIAISSLRRMLKENATKEDLQRAYDLLNNISKMRTKFLQNEVSRIHSSVFTSSDERVQRKINRASSMQFTSEQADLLQSLTDRGDNRLLSPIRPSYQRRKMQTGAAGKSAVGIYSNHVVFHSLLQQTEKPVQLLKTVHEEVAPEKIVAKKVPYVLTIGDEIFNSMLGQEMDTDEQRQISSLIDERLQTALDNESEQIMGRVGVNEYTINIDCLLTLMGFNKSSVKTSDGRTAEVSIPYFLLSQPIIADYVKEMKRVSGTTTKFDADREQEIIRKLYQKYTNSSEEEYEKKQLAEHRVNLTGQELYDNIAVKPDNKTQQAVLDLFLELKPYAQEFRSVQSKLNIQRSGLGESALTSLDKYENILTFPNSSSKMKNIEGLVGDFITEEDFYDEKEMEEDGYIVFRSYNEKQSSVAVRPTTYSGSLMIHAAKAGYELWSDYFPFKSSIMQRELDNILAMLGQDEVSEEESKNENKKLQLKYEIFQEMKKYFYSHPVFGVFSGDAQQERARLFKDAGSRNKSLSNYLNSLLYNTDEGSEFVKRSPLISRFRYTFNKNKPSLIQFSNEKGEDFNEEYKYQAIVELLDRNIPLPDFNGKPYTTRQLGMDMISYAYLEGGIQEAVQYIKYVPIPLLQSIGFAPAARKIQQSVKTSSNIVVQGVPDNFLRYLLQQDSVAPFSRFMRQYAQHKPFRIAKINVKSIKNTQDSAGEKTTKKEEIHTFVPKQKRAQPKPFLVIVNEDAFSIKDKNQLYEFDGEKYVRISTLGYFGMSEYSAKDDYTQSSFTAEEAQPVPKVPEGISEEDTEENSPELTSSALFSLNQGNVRTTIADIADSEIPVLSDLAKTFLPFVDDTVTIKLEDIGTRRGYYMPGDHTITINKLYLQKYAGKEGGAEEIAKTVLEEFMHSLTVRELSKYFSVKKEDRGRLLVPESSLPAHVLKLHRVLQEVASKLTEEFGEDFTDIHNRFTTERKRNEADKYQLLYSGSDIFEFVARITSRPDIIEKMDKITYKQTDKTLLQQFWEAIKDILRIVGLDTKPDSIISNAINEVYTLVKDIHEKELYNPSEPEIANEIKKTEEQLKNVNRNPFEGSSGNSVFGAEEESALSDKELGLTDDLTTEDFKC